MIKCPDCDNGVKTTCYKKQVFPCGRCQGKGQYDPNWIQNLAKQLEEEMSTWPDWMKVKTNKALKL